MRTNTSNTLQGNYSSLGENTQSLLINNLLTLFSFTEQLVYTIGYIQKTRYSKKIKNEKYKKAFADFYNRLSTLEIMTADTNSKLIQELLKMMSIYSFNQKQTSHGNQ